MSLNKETTVNDVIELRNNGSFSYTNGLYVVTGINARVVTLAKLNEVGELLPYELGARMIQPHSPDAYNTKLIYKP